VYTVEALPFLLVTAFPKPFQTNRLIFPLIKTGITGIFGLESANLDSLALFPYDSSTNPQTTAR
jgi:hypothetical protein